MASDNGVGEVEVFDGGLLLTAEALGDSATEDDRELVWWTDSSVGVE
jgi:hypothetical protein